MSHTLIKQKTEIQIRTLPKSLSLAAGLLKKKYQGLKKYHKKIRKEWSSSH